MEQDRYTVEIIKARLLNYPELAAVETNEELRHLRWDMEARAERLGNDIVIGTLMSIGDRAIRSKLVSRKELASAATALTDEMNGEETEHETTPDNSHIG